MSLQTHDLSLSIAGKNIVEQLNVCFNPGEFWGIMGVNGVGKSTLLQALLGLYQTDKGFITLENKKIKDYNRLELAQLTGMMHQEYDYNFPSTVLEAALIGRHPFIHNWQWENDQDTKLAQQALHKVRLNELSQRLVNTLSGGEKRRLNLATLLTQNPAYYLLDEPVNHLDIKAQLDILSLLKKHFQPGSRHCGIMVIHDPNLAYRYCDRILMMFNHGQYLSGKTADILNQGNLSRLYDCTIYQSNQQINNTRHTFFLPTAISEAEKMDI